MTKSLVRAEKIIAVLLSLSALFLYLFAIHDRQTAQGVGYYVALRFQREDRRLFDLGADLLRAAAFLGLLLFSCAVFKRKGAISFFRAFSLWIGMMPFVDGATLVHILFDAGAVWNSKMSLADRFWQSGAQILGVLRYWFPLLCLLLLCGRMFCQKDSEGTGQPLLSARMVRIFGVVQGLMCVLLLALPGFGEVWKFVFGYLLLLESIALIEELCEKNESWSLGSFWLFVLLWIRGICKMTEILSTSGLG